MTVELIANVKRFQGLSGDSKPTGEPVGSTFYETDTNNTYVYANSSWTLKKSSILLASDNDQTSPTLAFGDGDTGFYEIADDHIGISINGAGYSAIGAGWSVRGIGSRAGLANLVPSATVATVCPNVNDFDTGIGHAAVDQVSIIAGGKEGQRIAETTSGNDSLQHTLNGKLGQATGDEVAYSFNYETNKDTSGNDYGLVVNQTDTASPGSSYLLDCQVGSVSKLLVDNLGTPRYAERSSDPADPPEGYYVQWMSDGTGTGDDGDILIKITAGGSTKTATLVDFSAI